MKKLLLIIAIAVVSASQTKAQTKQYQKIEVTKFKGEAIASKLTKYKGGTIDIDSKIISIDKEAPKPQFYDIARVGAKEAQDEGYYAVEYICITITKSGSMKAVKVVAMYTPKNQLCDLIVKNGKTNTDYCITDK